MNQATKRSAKSNRAPRTVTTVPAGDGRTVFFIANPHKSPWPKFQHLAVDVRGVLSPGRWVAAFDDRKQWWYLGQVEDLQQSFTIRDVTTGDRVDSTGALLWQGDRQAPSSTEDGYQTRARQRRAWRVSYPADSC